MKKLNKLFFFFFFSFLSFKSIQICSESVFISQIETDSTDHIPRGFKDRVRATLQESKGSEIPAT